MTSFDVWSLGVIMCVLCIGHYLLTQHIANDELIIMRDQTRLETWHTISDDELSAVLASGDIQVDKQLVEDAKNLIRWMLKGDHTQRPTVQQILAHRFFNPDADAPAPQPMRYHQFISHAQADASGTASTMNLLYGELYMRSSLDMRQDHLTPAGMRQGVQHSDIFLLILTENVLSRWFCQQEILAALAADKLIQIMIEEDPRFSPFSFEVFKQSAAYEAIITTQPAICQIIESQLRSSIAAETLSNRQ